MKHLKRPGTVFGLVCLLINSAQAAVSGQIQAQLIISAGCQVTSGSAGAGALGNESGLLDFGSQGPTWNAPLNAQLHSNNGNLAVACGGSSSSPTSFTVSINGGTHGDGTSRYLSNGSRSVPYRLSVDAAGTDNYRIGQQHTFAAGSGTQIPIPVYGAVLANQGALPSGTYSDTLTVTLDW